jgi:hypothetical protein
MTAPFIPNSTYKKMEYQGVSEREVIDVWNNGEYVTFGSGGKGLKRRYESQGFEVGISYATMNSGQQMVTGVWKRYIGRR